MICLLVFLVKLCMGKKDFILLCSTMHGEIPREAISGHISDILHSFALDSGTTGSACVLHCIIFPNKCTMFYKYLS